MSADFGSPPCYPSIRLVISALFDGLVRRVEVLPVARARRSSSAGSKPATDPAAEAYRHKGRKRKNLPSAMLASAGVAEPKAAASNPLPIAFMIAIARFR